MIRRYKQFEVRGTCYVRYDGTPCKQFDLRGPIGDFLGDDSEVIQVRDLDEGWTRYWVMSNDPRSQQTIREIVEAYEC